MGDAARGQAHAISPDARSGILPALAPCQLALGILPSLAAKAGSIGMGLAPRRPLVLGQLGNAVRRAWFIEAHRREPVG